MVDFRRYWKVFLRMRIFIAPYYHVLLLDVAMCLVYFSLGCIKIRYEGFLIEAVSKNRDFIKLESIVKNILVFYLVYNILGKIRQKVNLELFHSVNIRFKKLMYQKVLKSSQANLSTKTPEKISGALNTMAKDLRDCSPDLFIEPFFSVIRLVVVTYFMYEISPPLLVAVLFTTPFRMFLMFHRRKENVALTKKFNDTAAQISNKNLQVIQNLHKDFSVENTEINNILEKEEEFNTVQKQYIDDPWAMGFGKGFLEKALAVILIWYAGTEVIEGRMNIAQLTMFNLQLRAFNGLISTIKNSSKALSGALVRYDQFFTLFTVDENLDLDANDQVPLKTWDYNGDCKRIFIYILSKLKPESLKKLYHWIQCINNACQTILRGLIILKRVGWKAFKFIYFGEPNIALCLVSFIALLIHKTRAKTSKAKIFFNKDLMRRFNSLSQEKQNLLLSSDIDSSNYVSSEQSTSPNSSPRTSICENNCSEEDDTENSNRPLDSNITMKTLNKKVEDFNGKCNLDLLKSC